MTGAWVPRSGTLAPPELPTAVTLQAQAMAGLSDTKLTSDRLQIMATAAVEVENWCGRVLWQAAGSTPRAAVTELEVSAAPCEVPACASLPQTGGVDVAIVSVELWDDSAAAYQPASYTARPGGQLLLGAVGIWRITATLDPGAAPPADAIEGLSRLFAYREVRRPTAATMAASEDGPTPPRLQGAVMKSGAAEALRYLRGAI